MRFSFSERQMITNGLKALPLGLSLELYEVFVGLDEEELDYEVSLSKDQEDIIVAALGELPAKISYVLICRMHNKFNEVIHGQGQQEVGVETRQQESLGEQRSERDGASGEQTESWEAN
jgi:hypothetical protein